MKLDARTAAELYRANMIGRDRLVRMLLNIGYMKHDAEIIAALSEPEENKLEYKEYTINEGGDSAAW